MLMNTVTSRKLNIIEIIMGINNDAVLKVIEDEALMQQLSLHLRI